MLNACFPTGDHKKNGKKISQKFLLRIMYFEFSTPRKNMSKNYYKSRVFNRLAKKIQNKKKPRKK